MANSDTEAARQYHQQTKHSYHSVRSSSHALDWANRPEPFKVYTDLNRIPLPDRWQDSDLPALASLLPDDSQSRPQSIPDLKDLARLLYYCGGITKRKPYPGGEILFRAASCTGALYEIELYVVCGDLNGLPAGVYHFNPRDFVLECLRSGDFRGLLAEATGREPLLSRAPVTIMSRPEATGATAWKYRARTYRHFGWDNGTILANLFAMSRALGCPYRAGARVCRPGGQWAAGSGRRPRSGLVIGGHWKLPSGGARHPPRPGTTVRPHRADRRS